VHEHVKRAARRFAPEENAAEAIYGTILIGALLAAESGLHDNYLDAIASGVIAAALAWLARAYSDLLGRRLEHRRRLTVRALARALREDWAIVRGATVPLLVLAIAWLAGTPLQTGITLALWGAVSSLIALELLAGIRADSNVRELTLEVVVGAAMGIGILVLKVLLH
jgi:hypothetical protein